MKTRADLQDWIREGMPLREPRAETCETFRVTVEIDQRCQVSSLRLVGQCDYCARVVISKGAWDPVLKTAGSKEIRSAARELTDWMAAHAMRNADKLLGEAYKAYTLDGYRVAAWTNWIIHRGQSGKYGGESGEAGQVFLAHEPRAVVREAGQYYDIPSLLS